MYFLQNSPTPGVILSTATGIMTDLHWKCVDYDIVSDVYFVGPSYNDTNWAQAVVRQEALFCLGLYVVDKAHHYHTPLPCNLHPPPPKKRHKQTKNKDKDKYM